MTSLPAPMLTVEEIAADLRLHPDTVRQYCREGKLPATRAFGAWRIDPTIYQDFKRSLFEPAVPADPYGFTPRDARSNAARRAAANRK